MTDRGTETLSVSELLGAVHAAIESLFPYEAWVEGEMTDLSRSRAGHVYFTIAEPGELGAPAVAALPVVLFEGNRRAVNALLRRNGGVRMVDGMQIRIRGRLDLYQPQGRLQMRMTSIDPTYTLGRLAAERDRVLAALRAERLVERNAALPPPLVPLRIGLVTAAGSAALADFLHELEASGLAFEVDHVDARVQGNDSEQSLVSAIRATRGREVDVVAVVRGGGARTDLAGFDSELMAREIATHPLPVHTGIGHETDESVCDLVAHRRHKTPTACAAALVETVQAFLRRVDTAANDISRTSLQRLDLAQTAITGRADSLTSSTARSFGRAVERLDARTATIRAHDPRRALARGWTITRTASGDVVRSIEDLSEGDRLRITFADGEAAADVSELISHPAAP